MVDGEIQTDTKPGTSRTRHHGNCTKIDNNQCRVSQQRPRLPGPVWPPPHQCILLSFEDPLCVMSTIDEPSKHRTSDWGGGLPTGVMLCHVTAVCIPLQSCPQYCLPPVLYHYNITHYNITILQHYTFAFRCQPLLVISATSGV